MLDFKAELAKFAPAEEYNLEGDTEDMGNLKEILIYLAQKATK